MTATAKCPKNYDPVQYGTFALGTCNPIQDVIALSPPTTVSTKHVRLEETYA